VEATLANSNVPPLAHPAVAGFQIALGVIIGGLTIALFVMGFFVWNSRQRNDRLALRLFIAGAVIVVVLAIVVVASH
jgi:ABC-type proline/glycine betaine transport system permease subunit